MSDLDPKGDPAEWMPIDTAPAGAWVWTQYASGHRGVHIKDEEEFMWEDETGDYTIEARANNGHGIVAWAYLPDEYVISDFEGSSRVDEPKANPPHLDRGTADT
jgi:hypothetical protein